MTIMIQWLIRYWWHALTTCVRRAPQQYRMVRRFKEVRARKQARAANPTMYCAHCRERFTETGTSFAGRPVHIECYHDLRDRIYSAISNYCGHPVNDADDGTCPCDDIATDVFAILDRLDR
jgi:hypothetical protein